MSLSPSLRGSLIFGTSCCEYLDQNSTFRTTSRRASNFGRLLQDKNGGGKAKKNACKKAHLKSKSKSKNSRRQGYFQMVGGGHKLRAKKAQQSMGSDQKGKKPENQYFTSQSKLSTGESLRRQRSLEEFQCPELLAKSPKYGLGSGHSSRKGKVNSKLNHKRQSNMYMDKVEKMMELENDQEVQRQQELKAVSGKEAARLQKLHNIQRAQMQMRIYDLRMEFNLLQRELLQ